MSGPPPNQWPYNTTAPDVPGYPPNNYPYATSPHYQANVQPQSDPSRPRAHNEVQYQNATGYADYHDSSVSQPYSTPVPSHGSRHTGYVATNPNSSAPPHPMSVPSHMQGQTGHLSMPNAYPAPPSTTSRQYDHRQVSQHQQGASHSTSTGWQADHGHHHNYAPALPPNQPPSASHRYQQPPLTGYTPGGDWSSASPPSGHQPTHAAAQHSPTGNWTSQANANYLNAQPVGLVGTRASLSPRSSNSSQWPTSPQENFNQSPMPVQGAVSHSNVKRSRSSHSHSAPDQQWQADASQPSWGLDTGTNYAPSAHVDAVYYGQPSRTSHGKPSSAASHSYSSAPSMTRNSSHSSSSSMHAHAPNVAYASGAVGTRPKCRRHGCSHTAYVDASTGEQNEWCGEAHQLEAVRTGHVPPCVTCAAMPQRRNSVYCSTLCETRIIAPAGYDSYRY